MYQDKTLTCRDCGAEFVFTAGEQEFYAEKGFQNEPTRCKQCRNARKNTRAAAPREQYETVCAECGSPFYFLSAETVSFSSASEPGSLNCLRDSMAAVASLASSAASMAFFAAASTAWAAS